jgi:hypothetical protein
MTRSSLRAERPPMNSSGPLIATSEAIESSMVKTPVARVARLATPGASADSPMMLVTSNTAPAASPAYPAGFAQPGSSLIGCSVYGV